jgi:hypothetical protein
MRKTTIGLLVIIGIWCLLQVPSISNSLSLFLVLNINPFTNKSLSLPTTLMILAIIAIGAAVFLFNDESSALIEGLLDWILSAEHDQSILKKSKAPKPVVLVRTKIKLPKLQYDLDTGWAHPVTAKRVPTPKFKLARQHNILHDFLNVLSAPLVRMAYKLVIAITVGEIMCARFTSRIILLAVLITQRLWRSLKSSAINTTVLTLTIAGYMLLISAIVGFAILRLTMPFVRKLTSWMGTKLLTNGEVIIIVRAFYETTHTFSNWYKEIRSYRSAHN